MSIRNFRIKLLLVMASALYLMSNGLASCAQNTDKHRASTLISPMGISSIQVGKSTQKEIVNILNKRGIAVTEADNPIAVFPDYSGVTLYGNQLLVCMSFDDNGLMTNCWYTTAEENEATAKKFANRIMQELTSDCNIKFVEECENHYMASYGNLEISVFCVDDGVNFWVDLKQ